ncbi:MAG: transcriptional regulator [Proteobacteria bacterium]|nr:transcriptional regulator [Pseudomonadota bacterium]
MAKVRFDTIIHAPNRLQICAFLTPLQEAEFQVIRDELNVSDSVLSKHLKQLEEVGYVKFRKSAVNGRQRMWASLTTSGRKAFASHVAELKRLAGVVSAEW